MTHRKTWEDMYFDGELDPFEEDFCEETQQVTKKEPIHKWDDYEELTEEEFGFLDED